MEHLEVPVDAPVEVVELMNQLLGPTVTHDSRLLVWVSTWTTEPVDDGDAR